jgi:hypothetical protein
MPSAHGAILSFVARVSIGSEEWRRAWRRESRLLMRVRRAAWRREMAELERTRAIASAHADGVSIRKIAPPTGGSGGYDPRTSTASRAAKSPARHKTGPSATATNVNRWRTRERNPAYGHINSLQISRILESCGPLAQRVTVHEPLEADGDKYKPLPLARLRSEVLLQGFRPQVCGIQRHCHRPGAGGRWRWISRGMMAPPW